MAPHPTSPGAGALAPGGDRVSPVAGPGGQRRGVCPTVRRPLPAGDGLLVRLRLAGAGLSTAQARAIADAAERHGSGIVELTSRANVQVRGVRPGTLGHLVDDLTTAGLVPLHPRDDVQADLVVAPASGADPTEVTDVRPLAGELRARLTAAALGGLPLHPKAGVAVDAGGAVTVRGVPAAVALGAVRRPTGEVAYELALGAALPLDAPEVGGTLVPVVTPSRAAEAAARLLRLAATDGPEPARMRDLVARRGLTTVLGDVGDLVEWVDPAGLTRAALPATPASPLAARRGKDRDTAEVTDTAGPAQAVLPATPASPLAVPPSHDRRAAEVTDTAGPATAASPATPASPLGVRPSEDRETALVGALPPLGRLDASLLRALAAALDHHGADGLRVTPGRGVVVAGLDAGAAEALAADLAGLGFVLDATDPAARVVACAGRPGCPAAYADTRSDGHRLVARLRDGARPGTTAHVSGCAKRCASRRAHDVTLVAAAGGYDLFVRDAAAADGERQVAAGLGLDDALTRAAAEGAL